MKADRLTTLLGILTALTGLMAMSTGKWIMGAIILLLSFGIFWNRGGSSINDRSIYENEVRTELDIEGLFERLKEMDTPLGRAWIAEHKGFQGKSIVFGPSRFKDCIVISRKSGRLNIKHITLIDNIIRAAEDEYRFDNLINTSEAAVTPKNYSIFAEFKLVSVMMVRHLRELIEAMSGSPDTEAPSSMDIFTFYYHNSSEGWFKNADDDEVLRVENSYNPFTAKLFNDEGEEMVSVKARKFDAKGHVISKAGFDIYANGEQYGEIYPIKEGRAEGYKAETEDGVFILKLFPACRRANISCNYTVERNGELKAVIGGSPKLIFEDGNQCQNDLLLSFDDDYLVLYAAFEIFVMTFNSSFLK
ncbi:MAG: hypothetical protein IKE52_02660 [Mogibacterium sp.]|nr:hypothetical protein [Mogibacterium sp.]